TAAWSTSCSRLGSSRLPRSITETCRRRSRIVMAGGFLLGSPKRSPRTAAAGPRSAPAPWQTSFPLTKSPPFVESGYHGFDVPVAGGETLHLGAAPGVELGHKELNQVRHHAVLAHGLAVQAIRARGHADTKVGFAENGQWAVPALDTPEYVDAAEKATREMNADFLTVMLEGQYTDAYLARTGAD